MTKTEIIQKATDAFNSHDSKKVAEYYTDNAVVYDPVYPEPLRGLEAIEKDAIGNFPRYSRSSYYNANYSGERQHRCG